MHDNVEQLRAALSRLNVRSLTLSANLPMSQIFLAATAPKLSELCFNVPLLVLPWAFNPLEHLKRANRLQVLKFQTPADFDITDALLAFKDTLRCLELPQGGGYPFPARLDELKELKELCMTRWAAAEMEGRRMPPAVEHLELSWNGDTVPVSTLASFKTLTSLDISESQISDVKRLLEGVSKQLRFLAASFEIDADEPLAHLQEEMQTCKWPHLEVLLTRIAADEGDLFIDDTSSMCAVVDDLPKLRVWSLQMESIRVLCDVQNIRRAIRAVFNEDKTVFVSDRIGPGSLRELCDVRVEKDKRVTIFFEFA